MTMHIEIALMLIGAIATIFSAIMVVWISKEEK